jgi:molybdate transport system substrate-binding protein
MRISATARSLALGVTAALLLASSASAAEVRVMISGGLTAAFNALVPEFERQTGNKVITSYGPSMGTTAGICVKSGAPKPDISSADALKRALLAAKSVAYSDSASGVYISTEMFGKLGITDQMKDKARKIPATPVAEIVARGDAEIGMQQFSEMLPVAGVDIVGPLPADLQKVTIFSAGIASVSKEPDAGKALIKFLASPAASATIIKSGLEPIPN